MPLKVILIIEDEKSLREAIVIVLKLKGFIVLEAHDGKQGLDMAFKHHPDLILLDIIMPELDGMAALQKLRADYWGKNVPVIILSNKNADEENMSMTEQMTACRPLSYLIKSDWKLHDIADRVEGVLALQK